MKIKFYFLLMLLPGFAQALFSQIQCPPPGFPEPGNTCPLAPILCENLDGYCSTINNNNVSQPFPGCSNSWTLNNDEWFAFYAGTTEIVIEVTPLNCTQDPGLLGLQGGIYFGCPSGVQIMDVQCSCTENPFILQSDDYIVGQIYYFVLDGCNGNICDYSIDVLEGSTVGMAPEDPGPLMAPSAVCVGSNSPVSVANVSGATIYGFTLTPAGIGTVSNFNNDSLASIQWGNVPGTAELCLQVSNQCYSNPNKSCTFIEVEPKPVATLSGGGFLCTPNDTASLTIQLSGKAPWEIVYSYNGVPQPALITSDNPFVLQTNQPGAYTLLAVSGGQADCNGTVSGSVQVVQVSNDTFLLDIQMPTCANPDSGQISIKQAAGSEFSLNGGAFQSDSVFTGLSAGTYTVTIRNVVAGCETDTTVVLTEEKITVQTQDSLLLCAGDTIIFGQLTITQPGTYVDTVLSVTGCDTIATVWVSGVDLPVKNEQFGLCPADSILINGIWYNQADTSFSYILPAGAGCDTLVQVELEYLPLPETTVLIEFCPGDSVLVNGVFYTAPDTLYDIILPALTGCDTIATYVLELLPQDTTSENLSICAGDSIQVNGQWFTSDTAFSYQIPQAGQCPTLAMVDIQQLPLPEFTQTIEFCPGDTVFIQGVPYAQPDTLKDIRLPSANDCDTLATYFLKYLQPDPPAQVSIDCPGNFAVNTDPGTGGAYVSFPDPSYGSDCPCPGLLLEQIAGPVSGTFFPTGATQVCFRAEDNCGNTTSCCFVVTVEESEACDVKTNVCLKFELLSITRNVTGDQTYRIRATNYCNNELIHSTIQLPDGVNALRPANSSYYTGPSGKAYLVRNPNASPQHSIRFKTAGSTGIRNGESEVFQYTLPEQSAPAYIHVTAKLWPNLTFAGHLNTFFCPVTLEPNPWNEKSGYRSTTAPEGSVAHQVSVQPNPNSGAFVLTWSGFEGETLHLRVLNAQGDVVLTEKLPLEAGVQALNLPAGSPAGPYAVQVFDDRGNRNVQILVKY